MCKKAIHFACIIKYELGDPFDEDFECSHCRKCCPTASSCFKYDTYNIRVLNKKRMAAVNSDMHTMTKLPQTPNDNDDDDSDMVVVSDGEGDHYMTENCNNENLMMMMNTCMCDCGGTKISKQITNSDIDFMRSCRVLWGSLYSSPRRDEENITTTTTNIQDHDPCVAEYCVATTGKSSPSPPPPFPPPFSSPPKTTCFSLLPLKKRQLR